jgi:hypothetical protein
LAHIAPSDFQLFGVSEDSMREHDCADEELQNATNQWQQRNETVIRQECILLIQVGRQVFTNIQTMLTKTMPTVLLQFHSVEQSNTILATSISKTGNIHHNPT